MSVLPAVETLSLKPLALAFAFQSVKIELKIAKYLSCLIVIVVLSEAHFNWFDTIWVTLWALLVVTQSQTNLIDGVFFYVTVTNDVRHLLKVCTKIKWKPVVMSATSQPVSLTCSFNAGSHISMRAGTSERDDTHLMSWTRPVSL